MRRNPNHLPDGRGTAICEGHEPGLPLLRSSGVPTDGGNPRAERETFEGLVEGDCDEEDDEVVACGDGEGHADEDRVEEDAEFEEEALEEEFLAFLLRGGVWVGLGEFDVGEFGGWGSGVGESSSGVDSIATSECGLRGG